MISALIKGFLMSDILLWEYHIFTEKVLRLFIEESFLQTFCDRPI